MSSSQSNRWRVRGAWGALLLLSIALHTVGLAERSFHHDESIHAQMSFDLAERGIYRYDPTYHGPLLYYLTAASYIALGDSDFTARLPIALCGIAMVLIAYRLRRPLGGRAAWWAGLLFTVSPITLYYGRFLRMDMLEMATASAALLAFLAIVYGRRRAWPWLGVWTAAAFATKENAYVTVTLLAVTAAMVGLDWGLANTPKPPRNRHLVGRLLASQWRMVRAAWRGLGFGVDWLWQSRWGVITSLGVFTVLSLALYTVAFTRPEDWNFPFKAISYWWGQHEAERVGGPVWFHLMRLAQYEFLPIAAATAWVIRRWKRLHPVELAIFSFGVASIGMYAYLGEKVPWLTVHQVWPFIPLAGAQLARTFGPRGRWWSRTLAVAGLAITVVFSVTANFVLDEITPNQQRVESIIYVQTCPELDEVIAEAIALKGSGEDPVAAVDGEAGWPLTWHWRSSIGIPIWWSKPAEGMRPPIVICDLGSEQEVLERLGPGYRRQRVPLRAWWSPELKRPSLTEIFRYLTSRVPWNAVGSTDVVILRRDDSDTAPITTTVDQVPGPLSEQLAVQSARILGAGWLAEPRGVSVRDGRLAVADTARSRIAVFAADGRPEQLRWPEQFEQPESVAWTPEGLIAVADTWHAQAGRAVIVDFEGARARPLPAPEGGWYGPRDVSVDASSGRLAVSDTGNKRVVIYSSGASSSIAVGSEGSAPGQLVEPVGIEWLEDGSLLICDTGNRRIQRLAVDGQPLTVVDLPLAWKDFYSRPQITAISDTVWVATDTPARCLWLVRLGSDGAPNVQRVSLEDTGIIPTGLDWEGTTLYLADLNGRVWALEVAVDRLR